MGKRLEKKNLKGPNFYSQLPSLKMARSMGWDRHVKEASGPESEMKSLIKKPWEKNISKGKNAKFL